MIIQRINFLVNEQNVPSHIEDDEVASWSLFPSRCITSTQRQPHIQTQGFGFLVRSHWLQYVYYFASQLHSSYQAHTQFLCFLWNADFLLKIDLQAVVGVVALLRNSLPSCHAPLCLTRTRARTTYTHSMPAGNPDLSNKTTPLNFGISEMQTNKCSIGRERKTGRIAKDSKTGAETVWGDGETNRHQQTSLYDGDDEDGRIQSSPMVCQCIMVCTPFRTSPFLLFYLLTLFMSTKLRFIALMLRLEKKKVKFWLNYLLMRDKRNWRFSHLLILLSEGLKVLLMVALLGFFIWPVHLREPRFGIWGLIFCMLLLSHSLFSIHSITYSFLFSVWSLSNPLPL